MNRARRTNAADALDIAVRRRGAARERWLMKLASTDPDVAAEVRRLLGFADGTSAPRGGPLASMLAVRTPEDEVGRVVGHRWRITRLLGVGAYGAVYEVEDTQSGRHAALKLVHGLSDERRRAMRRESAFLRWLRLPGFAPLIDDGSDGASVFCVTELAAGTTFPGAGRSGAWDAIEPVATRLLAIAGTMHAAGVVHRDLKPDNVLVDDGGTPTVVDLGISVDAVPGPEAAPEGVVGTPAYAAPEQLRGERADARADLYSIGVMLYEALAGRRPPRNGRPKCGTLAAPPRARRLVAALLASDRSQRPRDAWVALDLLQPPPPVARGPRWSEAALRERFHGPDRILHLREDAAAELVRRTAGRRAAVERELRSWVRGGFAVEDQGKLRVTRASLDLLRTLAADDPNDRALAEALRHGDHRAIVRAAMRATAARMNVGETHAAFSAAFEGAVAARQIGSPRIEERVLSRACLAALRTNSVAQFDRAVLLLQRAVTDSANVRDLETTMRGAIGLSERGATDALPNLVAICRRSRSDDVLRVTWSVRNVLARRLGPAEDRRNVRALGFWLRRSRTRGARSIFATATAYVRLRDARYAEAMRLHLEAARWAPDRAASARCLVDAAAAAVHASAPEADSILRRAARRIHSLRLPNLECELESLRRRVAMAAGHAGPADEELVAIATIAKGVGTSAFLAIYEASLARRTGDLAACRRLTRVGVAAAGADRIAAFIRAIGVAAGEPVDADEAESTAQRAAGLPPMIAAQTFALLALGRPELTPQMRRAFLALTLPADARDSARPREALSIDEVKEILRI